MATPNFAFDSVTEGAAGQAIKHNDAFVIVDGLMRFVIEDRDLATPPGSPTSGAAYLVAASGTGAWSGKDGYIAYYIAGWKFYLPHEGMCIWVKDEDIRIIFDGAVWVDRFAPAPIVCTIASSATTPNAAKGNRFVVSTNAAFTLQAPTNPRDQQIITIEIYNSHATTAFTLTLGSGITDTTAGIDTSLAALKSSLLTFVYLSRFSKWYIVAEAKDLN